MEFAVVCAQVPTQAVSFFPWKNSCQKGCQFEEIDIGSIPLYNQDLDTDCGPRSVSKGRELISASDAVLITLPEFNHSIPGVLKNALDWLSRPAFNSCFLKKPVLFATITPGPLGGVRAQSHMREVLASMLCNLPSVQEIVVTNCASKFSDGKLQDEPTCKHIQMVMNSFLELSGI
ncbi:NADPH-dependent FMN reductase [uncultured Cohaesibacter sp.]|uniref:NADPH-dependent FMN reductase n=1 Tax=uncultured Cohaesibacter sp. TaxID=1002546 RepID=UPI003748C263